MDQATELLNSLTEEQVMAYTASPETEEHIVINPDRTITVPESLKRIAVQYDHNVETVTFDCPRYWDEHDLSMMTVYIIYELQNTARSAYPAINKRVDANDPSMMHFDWRISNAVTQIAGTVKILICIKDVDDEGEEIVHWNSEPNRDMYVSAGMETDNTSSAGAIYDLATQLLERVDGIDTGYDIAVKNGFEGTEEEWLASLKGGKGDPGKSAYQYAYDGGYKGTEADFNAKLIELLSIDVYGGQMEDIDSEITFTIWGDTFHAIKGTKWIDWFGTEYDETGISFGYSSPDGYIQPDAYTVFVYENGEWVKFEDVIIPGHAYDTISIGTGVSE